jgi:flagellar L-ring protein precursor FlgH
MKFQNHLASTATTLMAAALLSACAGPMPVALSPEFSPVQPVSRDLNRAATGAIFATDNTDMWQARRRAYNVGDVITVLLNESTQAARTLNNETSRESSNDAVPAGLTNQLSNLFPSTAGLKTDGSSISNKGKGNADQKASLSGSIAVSVVEVQTNGNLVIRGEKQLSMSEGGEVIQVSGVIRPDDVSAISTVQSRRLANAQIAYRAAGDLANATRAGWGTSAIWKYWPF